MCFDQNLIIRIWCIIFVYFRILSISFLLLDFFFCLKLFREVSVNSNAIGNTLVLRILLAIDSQAVLSLVKTCSGFICGGELNGIVKRRALVDPFVDLKDQRPIRPTIYSKFIYSKFEARQGLILVRWAPSEKVNILY